MDTRNVIAAISLSACVILLWGLFFSPPAKNVNQLENIRAKEIEKPPSLEQSKEYLNKVNKQQQETSINTAFKLINKDEEIRKRENAWWKKYKQLKNL